MLYTPTKNRNIPPQILANYSGVTFHSAFEPAKEHDRQWNRVVPLPLCKCITLIKLSLCHSRYSEIISN